MAMYSLLLSVRQGLQKLKPNVIYHDIFYQVFSLPSNLMEAENELIYVYSIIVSRLDLSFTNIFCIPIHA